MERSDGSQAEALPADLPPAGALLLGKYRVGGMVGRGGMGAVLSAYHEHLNELVALKLLLREVAGDRAIRGRFRREGEAVFKLRSEHICRVLDAGELEDGTPFIAMEFLNGHNLARVLRQRGRIPVPEAVDYLLQACEGIAEAHANGIVHRDLKPQNIVLTTRRDGSSCVKVIDFGISKMATMATTRRPPDESTNTFAFIGSARYAAPEQLLSARSATTRTDVWALGVILYEMVMGEHPFVFSGSTFAIIATTVAKARPQSMCARAPEVPRGLEAVVFRCLEKDPANRFDSVASLAEALAPFATDGDAGALVSWPRVSNQSHPNDRVVDGSSPRTASLVVCRSSPVPYGDEADTTVPDMGATMTSLPADVPKHPAPARMGSPHAAALLITMTLSGIVFGVYRMRAEAPGASHGGAFASSESVSAPSPLPPSSESVSAAPAPELTAPSDATPSVQPTTAAVESTAHARAPAVALPSRTPRQSSISATASGSAPRLVKDWLGAGER